MLSPFREQKNYMFLQVRSISTSTICRTRQGCRTLQFMMPAPTTALSLSGWNRLRISGNWHLSVNFGMRRSNKNGNDAPTIRPFYCSCRQHGFFLIQTFTPDNLYDKVHHEFPGAVFVDHIGGDGRVKAEFKPNAIPFSVPIRNARGLDTTSSRPITSLMPQF